MQLKQKHNPLPLFFSQCCPARGIGFTTIYNDRNQITNNRDIDEIKWLTSTNGSFERDPVMARMFIGIRTKIFPY